MLMVDGWLGLISAPMKRAGWEVERPPILRLGSEKEHPNDYPK
jgi:hypothetical protein